MNLAFALGGGAARGAFHLGVLNFCEENNIIINAYSGCSIGAIIAASHASGVSAKNQLEIFSSKELREIFKFNYLKGSLVKIDFNTKIVKELLPIDNLEDISKPVFVNSYDIKTKKSYYFDKGNTIKLCLASSALIPLFNAVKYEKMYLIDGGVNDNLPLKPLENKNYDICSIDLFATNKATNNRKFKVCQYLKKKFLTQLYENKKYTLNKTKYYIGNPKIRNFSLFTFSELDECFKFGYKEAEEFFKNI